MTCGKIARILSPWSVFLGPDLIGFLFTFQSLTFSSVHVFRARRGLAELVSSRALTSLQAQNLMIKMGLPLEEVEEEPEVPLPVKKLGCVLGEN